MSLFSKGGPKKTGPGPTITRVTVKKAIPPKPAASPAIPSYKSASSSSKNGTGTHPSSSSSKNNGQSSSRPSIKGKEKEKSRPSTSGTTKSPSASASAPVLKRKVSQFSKVESESESEEEEDAVDLLSGSKRARTNASSTPLFGAGDERIGLKRKLFKVNDGQEARREWEWEGFVPGEDVVMGVRKAWTEADGEQSQSRPRSLLDKYVAYFPQEEFKKDSMPFVELQYPAKGCREKFFLLTPTAAREYAPLRELRTAIQQILEFYIPPSHRHIFGTLSDSIDLESPSLSRLQSPAPGLPTPPPAAGTSPPGTPTPAIATTETIADAIRKALASNRKDGPGFVKAMERFNTAMREIQDDGTMASWLEQRGREVKSREWAKLVDVVHDQAYSRVVGPYSNELEHHPRHSDEVARAISAKEDAYGELRHDFMTKVIEQTGLGSDSVFVDLGSGVGNCVMQVALQAGSRSYGFELLPVPAHCARLQLQETKKRWAMWCLAGNPDVEVYEGDFRTIPEVVKRLNEADVVLVNNEVFPSSLNIDLTNMFLDLKEGAKIVSLKPFVPEGFRMNESNCDSFAAIVKLESHHYAQGWVSWKGDSGRYYIQTIDRSARIKYEQRLISGRSSRR